MRSPSRRQAIMVVCVAGIVLGSALVSASFAYAPRPAPCSTCVLGTIQAGWGPISLAYDPSAGDLLALDSGSHGWGVTAINGSTDQFATSFSTSDRASAMTYDPENGNLYLTPFLGDNITVRNALTGAFITTIPTPATALLSGPYTLTYDAATGYIDVLQGDPGLLLMINGSTNQVVGSYPVAAGGGVPMATNPDNGEIYLVRAGQGAISYLLTVNGRNGTNESSIPFTGFLLSMVYDPVNGQVYVGSTAPDFVSGSPGLLIAVSGDGTRELNSVPVGPDPTGIAVDPITNTIYVSNAASNNISIVNGSDDRSSGSVGVGPDPLAIAFDNANGCLYALSYQGVPQGLAQDAQGYVSVVAPPRSSCPAPPVVGPPLWQAVGLSTLLVLIPVLLVLAIVRKRRKDSYRPPEWS